VKTYSFQISVYHAEVMHVLQAFRNVGQLSGRHQQGFCGVKRQRTSSARLTFLSFSTNSLMFPCSIHSETRANRCLRNVTPSNGKMLGWRRCFHATPSRQNPCNPFTQADIMV